MARKAKVAEASDNFDDSHNYKCLRCGKTLENPVGTFYKSQWSDSYLKNDRFAPLCKNCVNEMFGAYEKKYGTNMACIFMCYKLDIPYYYSLYDSIIKNNNNFSMGLYMRQINGKQYQYQDFTQSILSGEVGKTKEDFEEEKEVKWGSEDLENRDNCISIIGYDPFEGYPEADRKFLFNQLAPYLEEDDISEDTFKLSQIIQVVNNNKQIWFCDKKISTLDPVKDANDIKTLNTIKKDLVANNDKIAKENEISVKNRSNKEVGKSTLSYLQKSLRELDIPNAEENYYDQLTSTGSLWAIDMSIKAIHGNALFDENDKQEIYESTLSLNHKLNLQLDEEKEKYRLLLIEFNNIKEKLNLGDCS